MKKVFKLTGSFFRTLPDGTDKFLEHGAEIDDLSPAEISSLGNKVTFLREVLEPSDERKGIDPEVEADDSEVNPSPVAQAGETDDDAVVTDPDPEEGGDEVTDPEVEDPEDEPADPDEDPADPEEGAGDDPEEVEGDEDPEDEDPEDEEPLKASHVGGGWYLLPDGKKVHGKDNIPPEWR